jgi:hypothetical protein
VNWLSLASYVTEVCAIPGGGWPSPIPGSPQVYTPDESENSGAIRSAFDGDPTTAWTTFSPPNPRGYSIFIDFGVNNAQAFDTVMFQFQAGDESNYEVAVVVGGHTEDFASYNTENDSPWWDSGYGPSAVSASDATINVENYSLVGPFTDAPALVNVGGQLYLATASKRRYVRIDVISISSLPCTLAELKIGTRTAGTYFLSTAVGAGGTITPPGTSSHSSGAGVTVSVGPALGNAFMLFDWTDDIQDTTVGSVAVTMNADKVVYALFYPISTPSATIGTAYSFQLPMNGGTPPCTWAVATGTLPPGLTLDPTTGVISGTPVWSGT